MTSDSRCRLPFWKFISTFFVGWMLLTSSIGGAANGNTSNQIWHVELKSIPKLYSEEFRNKFLENILKGFSEEDIDDAIVFLHSKSAVDQVKVYENEEGRIEFKVEIAPLVSSIEFKSDTDLSVPDLIYASGLVKDMSWRASLEDDARLRLKEYLTDLGFPDAQLEFSKDLHGDTVSVVVTVHEGDALVLKEIRFISPNDILVEGLKRETKSYLNEPLSQKRLSDLQKEIRKYLAAKSYLQADLKQMKFLGAEKQKVLEVEISRPEKFQVEFKGNNQESRGSLEDHLALEEFQTTNPNIGLELVARTKQYYLNKGYARAEVNHSEVKVGDFDKKIVIEIDEGPKVKIENLVVMGVDSLGESKAGEFIRKNSSTLIKKNIYNKDDFEKGLNNLIIELQNNGYLHARLISSRVQYNKNKDAVGLYAQFDQGPLTEIQSIEFSGNTSYTGEQLLAVAGINRSGPLRLNVVEEAIVKLRTHYHENGYIEMDLQKDPEKLITYNTENTLAKVRFVINEGPQVRIGSIVIEGNTFTLESVIRNEISLEIGQILPLSLIEETRLRLQKTAFFSSVEVKTLEERTQVSERTLIVRVRERDPGLFSMGIGATNERTLTMRGYLGVAYRNLAGTGRGVALRLEGNYNVTEIKYLESKVILSYVEPYLFNTRVRGRINVTRSRAVTNYDIRQASEVNQTTYSVEEDFTSHILGIWDVWSLATVRDYGLDEKYPYVPTELDIATTGPTLDFDFRDNPFNPTTGSFSRFSMEYSGPVLGSSRTIEYWRSSLSYTHYIPINESTDGKTVWANQVRWGYLENLSHEADGGVPYEKKGFVLGGRTTVRGFETGTSEVFPNRFDLGSDKYILKTNAQMFLFKSEMRIPIVGNFAAGVFYDGGMVTIQGLSIYDPYRDSAGVGIRYNTPFGPFNLEWAWKLDRREGEDPWRFHLSIGTF